MMLFSATAVSMYWPSLKPFTAGQGEACAAKVSGAETQLHMICQSYLHAAKVAPAGKN